MKDIMEEMTGDQLNEGEAIKGKSTLGELKAVEVVVVANGTSEEVTLGTPGVESGRRNCLVIQGHPVAFHQRRRQEAEVEGEELVLTLMLRRKSGKLQCLESGGRRWAVEFQAGTGLC